MPAWRSLWRGTRSTRRLALGATAGLLLGGGAVLAETRIPISSSPDHRSGYPPAAPRGTSSDTPVIRKCSVDDLCSFIKEGRIDLMASVLSNNGVDTNGYHSYGFTPLSLACCVGTAEMVQLLLEHGADPNAADSLAGGNANNKRYAMQVAMQLPRLHDSALNKAVPLPDGMSPLHHAVLKNRPDVASVLISHGASPDRPCGEPLQLTPQDMLRFSGELADPASREAMQNAIATAVESRRRFEKEQRRKYPLEERLKEHIVGQLGPLHSVAAAVRRKENGWHDPTKPLVFLFLGSSGIGKTEMAKQLAKYLHPETPASGAKGGSGEGFIRIDMSEYQHSHEVSKFIGAPPGYVGHQQGGQLTQKLQEKPDAVVLLDEVEKAHPDVLTTMLQVFDEGRITDGKGNTIDCKDAIFVMTSNLGQRPIADEAVRLRLTAASAENSADKARQLPSLTQIGRSFKEHTIQPILRRAFKRDEFIGRINEILFFLPFTDGELEGIVEKELRVWRKIATERHGIDLAWTPSLVKYLKGGYNMRYGARSIKYEIDRSCIALIAREHEADRVASGDKVTLDFKPEEGEARVSQEVSPAAGEVLPTEGLGADGGDVMEAVPPTAGDAASLPLPQPPRGEGGRTGGQEQERDIEGVYYSFPPGEVRVSVEHREKKPQSGSWSLF